MHQVTLPFGFCAICGVTVLALLPTPAPVVPPPGLLPPPPQPTAVSATHARIAPALASFLFTMSLLTGARTVAPGPSCLSVPYPCRRGPNQRGLLSTGCVG